MDKPKAPDLLPYCLEFRVVGNADQLREIAALVQNATERWPARPNAHYREDQHKPWRDVQDIGTWETIAEWKVR